MCTIARTSQAVFKAYVDLHPNEQVIFRAAFNQRLNEEKDRAIAEAVAEYGEIVALREAEIDTLKKARDKLKSDRDSWRDKAKKLKRHLRKHPAGYKQRETNRILRLVTKKGRDWAEIGRIMGLNPDTVESRFYRELRRLKDQ